MGSDQGDVSSLLQDPAVFHASMKKFSNSAEGLQPEKFWVQIHRPIHTSYYLEPKYARHSTELWRELNPGPRMQKCAEPQSGADQLRSIAGRDINPLVLVAECQEGTLNWLESNRSF